MSLLTKLLEKRNIKSLEELTKEERATFDGYQQILSKKELTVADIKQFLEGQLSIIETRWKDFNIDQAKKAELIPYFTVYKVILQAIDSPQAERAALEQLLIQQIESQQ